MVGRRKQGRPLEVFWTVSEIQGYHGLDVVGAGIVGEGITSGARQIDVDETATDIDVQLEPASKVVRRPALASGLLST